jgi:mRNA interferase RelE/StbE
MYEVVLSNKAQRIYRSADLPLAKKIAKCFEQLEQTPRFHLNVKALKGELAGYYRYRLGDHRVV